jgi:hypothetical protein
MELHADVCFGSDKKKGDKKQYSLLILGRSRGPAAPAKHERQAAEADVSTPLL